MADETPVEKAYEIDVTKVHYLNDLDREKSASARLKATDGIDVDFENPAQVRDKMEQTAAQLTCKTPEQKQALNDFLAAIQKPDITAKELKKAVRDLDGGAFDDPAIRHNTDDGRLLNALEGMATGMSFHETTVADGLKLANLVAGVDPVEPPARSLPPAAPPKL